MRVDKLKREMIEEDNIILSEINKHQKELVEKQIETIKRLTDLMSMFEPRLAQMPFNVNGGLALLTPHWAVLALIESTATMTLNIQGYLPITVAANTPTYLRIMPDSNITVEGTGNISFTFYSRVLAMIPEN